MNITNIVIGLAVLVLLLVRQLSKRSVRQDRQPIFLLVLLWIVAIAAHFGIDVLVDRSSPVQGLATAALTLYIAVSFGVQRFVVRSRAAKAAV